MSPSTLPGVPQGKTAKQECRETARATAVVWRFLSLQNCVETLTPKVMVLGGEAFAGRGQGWDEISALSFFKLFIHLAALGLRYIMAGGLPLWGTDSRVVVCGLICSEVSGISASDQGLNPRPYTVRQILDYWTTREAPWD